MSDVSVVEVLREENARLRADAVEHQFGFDLHWKADMRAIKRWQEATGRILVWPDHADLCVWLLGQNALLQVEIERLRNHEGIPK